MKMLTTNNELKNKLGNCDKIKRNKRWDTECSRDGMWIFTKTNKIFVSTDIELGQNSSRKEYFVKIKSILYQSRQKEALRGSC